MGDKGMIEQLHAELTQAQIDKGLAQQGNLLAMQDVTILRTELSDVSVARDALAQERDQLKRAWEYSARSVKECKDELVYRQESQEYTDGILRKTNDELAGALTQTRKELAGADEAMDAVQALWRSPVETKEQNANLAQAREELAASARLAKERKNELEQARAELVETEEDFMVAERTVGELRTKLRDVRNANQVLVQRVTDMKKTRDYWYDKALEAEAERDEARKVTQEQSDAVMKATEALRRAAATQAAIVEAAEVLLEQSLVGGEQRKARIDLRHALLCRSKAAAKLLERLAEGERLKRQLTHTQNQLAAASKAAEWLWGYYDGNTLVAKPGYGDEINEAWNKLLVAADSTPDAIQLQERLATFDAALMEQKEEATRHWRRAEKMEVGRDYWRKRCKRDTKALDAAEAALAGCGIGGIYDEFDGLADAITQMAEHIKSLKSQ